VKELVEKRCRRAIAIVLSAAEKENIPQEARTRLRKVVMDQFNDLTSLGVDVMESMDQGMVLNELWLEKLDEIHSRVVRDA
jgi:hypothetical protein